MKIEDISRKKVLKILQKAQQIQGRVEYFCQISCPSVQTTATNQENSTSATTSTTLRRYQVQKKNVKLQFSYKAKKEIVALYVTPMPGVSHKADVTLEPWKVDQ